MDSGSIQAPAVKEVKQPTNISSHQQPKQTEIQEIFKPLGNHLCKFFEEAKHDPNGYYSIPQIRTVLTDYINIHRIADLNDQK